MTARPPAAPLDPELDTDAAEYALGTLEGPDRVAFEARLAGDHQLSQAVAEWQRRLAPLADFVAPEPVPPELWTRIEAAIATTAAFPTIRAEEGSWQRLVRGVDLKLLHVDAARGYRSFLLRFAPGSTLPAHDHADDEECVMISGEAFIGGMRLTSGDWQLAPRGQRHPPITSPTGGIIYIRSPMRRTDAT